MFFSLFSSIFWMCQKISVCRKKNLKGIQTYLERTFFQNFFHEVLTKSWLIFLNDWCCSLSSDQKKRRQLKVNVSWFKKSLKKKVLSGYGWISLRFFFFPTHDNFLPFRRFFFWFWVMWNQWWHLKLLIFFSFQLWNMLPSCWKKFSLISKHCWQKIMKFQFQPVFFQQLGNMFFRVEIQKTNNFKCQHWPLPQLQKFFSKRFWIV